MERGRRHEASPRSKRVWQLLAALCWLVGGVAAAQTGSLRGRLTDLHSQPVAGATVVLRNAASGAEARTVTSKDGSYHFASLEPGAYVLDAATPNMGHGEVDGIVISAGHE